MSALTDDRALDIAWARPASIPCPLINYSGPAFAGLEQLLAWGQPFIIGFESSTTRAYAGYAEGRVDARALLDVLRTIPDYLSGNYSTWMCAADANSTPAWALPGVQDYFAGAADEFLAIGYRPKITFGYGNPEASAAAVAGVNGRGLRGERWGIGTWREGEGGGPNQPPAVSTAAMLQSGNTPGPAEGTDLDWLYLPIAQLGFNNGPSSPTPARSETDMDICWGKNMNGDTQTWLANGSVASHQFTGAPGAYGIPQDALDYHAANPTVEIRLVSPGVLDTLYASRPEVLTAAIARAVATPGSGPTPPDTTAIEAAIVAADTAIEQAKQALAAVKG